MTNYFRNGAIFVCGGTLLGLSIGEIGSLVEARDNSMKSTLTAVVQNAVDSGDCGLGSVRGGTFRYNVPGDTLNFYRPTGTVTVGPNLEGVIRGSGKVIYHLDVRDNVSGHLSTGDMPSELPSNNLPFGYIEVNNSSVCNGTEVVVNNSGKLSQLVP